MLAAMRMTFGFAALLAGSVLGFAGCYQEYQPATTPSPHFQPGPTYVQGPPGGEMDAETGYTASPGRSGAAGGATPSADPQDPGYVMGSVTDAEIDATLEGHGVWVEDAEYGRIWRPDVTLVGADFTPYETCGTWVWTDFGWTFACDWDWGWLPFHYGYWGWFDDYWAWVPDYTWSPAWVEWRSGGGYTGWRPIGPHVRDHRNGRSDRGPIVRDHRGRRTGNADWRFVADRDLGRHIRGSLVHGAEGLRVTSTVARPPVRPTRPAVAVTHVMKSRLAVRDRLRGADGVRGSVGSSPSTSSPRYPSRPAYDRPTFNPSRPAYDRPTSPPGYDPRPTPVTPSTPTRTYPVRPTFDRPATPPSSMWSPRGSSTDSRPSTYSPPTYSPPPRSSPSYSAPVRAPSPSSAAPASPTVSPRTRR